MHGLCTFNRSTSTLDASDLIDRIYNEAGNDTSETDISMNFLTDLSLGEATSSCAARLTPSNSRCSIYLYKVLGKIQDVINKFLEFINAPYRVGWVDHKVHINFGDFASRHYQYLKNRPVDFDLNEKFRADIPRLPEHVKIIDSFRATEGVYNIRNKIKLSASKELVDKSLEDIAFVFIQGHKNLLGDGLLMNLFTKVLGSEHVMSWKQDLESHTLKFGLREKSYSYSCPLHIQDPSSMTYNPIEVEIKISHPYDPSQKSQSLWTIKMRKDVMPISMIQDED